MRYKGKTLEELEDIELDLLEQEGVGRNDGFYGRLIGLYEEMYKLAKRSAKETGNESDLAIAANIRKQLIKSLILYGTYIKMGHEKSDRDAEVTLQKVINYDARNPIVHYRLGFLAYKSRQYHKACLYFQQAIEYQGNLVSKEWQLNEQQLYHAHLFLVNSSLFVAKETNEKLQQLSLPGQQLTTYQLSPLFEMINSNTLYLNQHAFVKHTPDGRQSCSKEECDDIYEGDTNDHCIILYFSDRECGLRFNKERKILNATYARMLKDFLLHSSKKQSLIQEDLIEHFNKGKVKRNTFIQKIGRLRDKLAEFDILNIIDSDGSRSQTAYYYNEEVPYIIMERVEEVID